MKYSMRALVMGAALLFAAPGMAGETPAPDGAEIYIISPADGAKVKSPVQVVFGMRGMGVAPAGVEKENFRIELFVKNLLDDDSWAACSRFSEFDLPNDGTTSTLYQSIIVAPQNKRQFGLKTAITF